ncbi:MAG: hypothetical protein CL928_15780 [Deltaproteobacteria bacterium]|nr:hypothetical protein [Deltaproteobacteria bacterium]
MMDWLQALLLGALQGLTEFLPVSSSGHLVLFQEWLGEAFFAMGEEGLFIVLLHAGTLLPVLWFYRADLMAIVSSLIGSQSSEGDGREHRQLAIAVTVATIPTGAMGLLFQDLFERLFTNVSAVCAALLVTAGLLLATRFRSEPEGSGRPPTIALALLLGLVQGLAITPGISRSGATIAAALFLGMGREQAARLSFLMSVPAICGALALKLSSGISLSTMPWGPALIGFVTAVIVGYGALVLLVALVRRGQLHRFAAYLIPLAALAYLFLS